MVGGKRLSDELFPLIFGTATFNYQFNKDPYALNPNTIVEKALAQGVRAFDTSPYYGPAEEILGAALSTNTVKKNYTRSQYQLLTKIGRVSSDTFDYSPSWVRYSVKRSCRRLHTTYLDVVYCHDVEFVSPLEVLTAVQELRRIRDEQGTVKYVGICGYPVDVLASLAEYVLQETGEPLDVVQSYANFNLQNQRLLTHGLERFVNAGVDVVTNASPLGMGLLRGQGVPVGAMGNWHPAPDGLREACVQASLWANSENEKLEVVAVRFAMENWLREGAKVGTYGRPLNRPSSSSSSFSSPTHDAYPSSSNPVLISSLPRQRLGVSVMGVSKLEELDETMRVWRSVMDGLSDDVDTHADSAKIDTEAGTLTPTDDAVSDHEWSLQRRQRIRSLARYIRQIFGEWTDYAWASPEPGFVNQRKEFGYRPAPVATAAAATVNAMLTPPLEPEHTATDEDVDMSVDIDTNGRTTKP